MADVTTLGRTVAGSARPRGRWNALLVVFVVAVVALGAWLVIEFTGTDQLAVATDLIDEFLLEANNNDDGEAAAALFTADGVVDLPDGSTSQGREAIAAHVNGWAPNMDSWERVGDVIETSAGGFMFIAEGNYGGVPYEGRGVVELDGDLIAKFIWYGGGPLSN